MKNIILLILILFTSVFAQNITVKEIITVTQKHDGQYYFPRFSPDDSKLFFTTINYTGLWYYDFSGKEIIPFAAEQGAGYEFAFTKDGNSVIYRVNEYNKKGIKIAQKIVEKDLFTNEQKILEAGKYLSTPKVLANDQIVYTRDDKIITKDINKTNPGVQTNTEPFVCIEKTKIVLYKDSNKKILTPLGNDIHYIWTSLSPDNTKLLFTAMGKGTYITDLNGKILVELGYANAPKWSADGKWISYMVDKDDGHVITSSDIFVSSADGKNKFQLTDTKDVIEMYPEWANSNNDLVFHSDDGRIFLMKLNIN